jgi:Fe-S-cluster-containing hydrogenase component 2
MIDEFQLGGSGAVVTTNQLRKRSMYPEPERFQKGPVPIIECIEEIPCNPCETICKRNAIRVGKPITNLPVLIDSNACSGCGQCVVICPGQAIFIVDQTFSYTEASIMLPYELLPLPSKGDAIEGINRTGRRICRGYVHEVRKKNSFDHTALVTIAIPKEHADEVRFFRIAP